MEKLNLNEYLFHGLEPWNNFDNSRKPIESIEILEKILNTDFIASRRLLKEILSEEEYKLLDTARGINWNKDDWVSIVPTLHPEIEGIHSVLEDYPDTLEGSYGFAYNCYVQRFPSIILNSKLLQELKVNEDGGPRFIGEIQIKDKIPSNYFVGVTLPGTQKIDLFLEYMNLVNSPSGGTSRFENKPRHYEEEREDLSHLTEEEFVRKYYKTVMLFEEVLRRTESNLKLYYAATGIQIPSSIEQMKEVEKVKQKLKKSF